MITITLEYKGYTVEAKLDNGLLESVHAIPFYEFGEKVELKIVPELEDVVKKEYMLI